MNGQLELELPDDDYSEEWMRSKYSCFDCAHIRRPMGNFMQADHCMLRNRTVDRVTGMCSEFKEMNEDE